MQLIFYYDVNCPYSTNARPYAKAIAKEFGIEYIEYKSTDETVPEIFKSNEYPQFHLFDKDEIKKTFKGYSTAELQSQFYRKGIEHYLQLLEEIKNEI